ncbi:MAG: response regulator [bacterium]
MNNRKRILLVDDNNNDVELILTVLDDYHLADEVVVVRDGKETLDYLYCRGNFKTRSKGNPVVVLLDLKLPKVNGLEVLRQIKSDDQLKIIPVVIITSSCEERDVGDSYKLGVNAYVVKSVNFQQFFEAVMGLGLFWAVINEPPPGSVRKEK